MLKAVEFGLLAVSLLIVFALIVIGPKRKGVPESGVPVEADQSAESGEAQKFS